MEYLTFIELQGFSKRRKALLTDEQYQRFQTYLLENHQIGSYLQQTGGCQKIRWAVGNKGKSGGIRVIYYVLSPKGRIYLLLVYTKNEQDNLSDEERAIMRKIVEQLQQETTNG
ncbi:hypothetical protein A1D22_06335 [Pasteurellaceae bacterium LFhippo2]|nr:hypothetical protein [Pasteurellaceae bacterium LFhippo2]